MSGGRNLLVAGVGDDVLFGADGKPVDDGLLGVLEEDLHVGVVGVPGEGVKEGSLPGAVLCKPQSCFRRTPAGAMILELIWADLWGASDS